MTTLEAWLLAAALHFAPPEKAPKFDGHVETVDEATARYASIAHDIAAAVDGRKEPKNAASLALAWALGESGLAHDADVGPCYRKGAYRTRCDSGQAATLWQLHAHRDRETGEPVTLPMLFDDRALAARIAVRGLVGSWTQCRHLEPRDRFSGFGVGHCVAGVEQVRRRYQLWLTVRAWEAKP